jgi:hypothetical protein
VRGFELALLAADLSLTGPPALAFRFLGDGDEALAVSEELPVIDRSVSIDGDGTTSVVCCVSSLTVVT